MKNYYLAIDIGASGGRHILGSLENGKMLMEEVYRFSNGLTERDGHLVWDVEHIFREIINGMKACACLNKIPCSVGIDTWGVDYVLLDKHNNRIGDAISYRDKRTHGMDVFVYQKISEKDLYARSGIQKQIYNTIYQLMAEKVHTPERLEQAKTMLMMPDYFRFLLSGRKASEYTIATTSQLVSSLTKKWDYELIEKLGYPKDIFAPMVKPGTVIGNLTETVQAEVGFDCQVIAPASHDTASAVVAIPTMEEHVLYISSGTWSLMGTEIPKAECSMRSREANLTNEGGYAYRFRYLKNIMGLWMVQSVRRELAPEMSFAEICELAEKESINSIVDAYDERFLSPACMVSEIRNACEESEQAVPEGIAEIAAVIYQSLARCYGTTMAEIEALTGHKYTEIYIVGGGANADYLNRLTAKSVGRKVYAGPQEATAIGNLGVQMIAQGELKDIKAVRECVQKSFEVKEYVV